MAGAVLERELTTLPKGRVAFDLATKADDAEIRRLLRDNPLPGRISLSLEREPDYFADAELPHQVKRTIVARDGGRVVCVGYCTIRQRFVNGQPLRVGYLGGLRLDASHAGRFDILRRGYEFFRELQASTLADFYFTSMAADNWRARQLLERGVRGMPRYEFLCAFVTLVIPTRGPRDAALLAISKQEESIPLSLDELTAFVNEHNRTCQFAPCWSASELSALRPLGLHSCDFCVIRNGGRVAASGALWDQRQFKQTVIRGYTPWLALTRPAYNVLAQVTKHPQFPAIGDVVAGAFVSHLASRTDAARPLIDLIGTLRALANRRGIQLLTLGFAANDPRLATVRDRFRNREYRSRLYVVHWQGIGGSACALDGRISAPEVALL